MALVSSEHAHVLETLGMRREEACQTLVRRMLHFYQKAESSWSMDDYSDTLLCIRTILCVAPYVEEHWFVLRDLTYRLLRLRTRLQNDLNVSESDLDRLADDEEPLICLDAELATLLGLPCFM